MKLLYLDEKIPDWNFCLIVLLSLQPSVHAQNTIVRGTVVDEDGAALPGGKKRLLRSTASCILSHSMC